MIVPSGGSAASLTIDNKPVDLTGTEKATLYVKNQLSFDTGKMTAQWIAENKDGISGAVQG